MVLHIYEFFESAEHEDIGDKVTLLYDSGNISGADFNYTIGSQSLSYGLIVALAGDYYANYSVIEPGDQEQISDHWDDDPERSITLATKIMNTLLNDDGGYLASILKTMAEQEQIVRDGIAAGKDPAQVYKSVADKFDYDYATDTNLGYVAIALTNWDHFGIDAINAYSSVHTAALRQAKKAYDASSDQVYALLKKAYFFEAFAQHFLTDLFSTGHLRTPRRILHWTFLGDNGPSIPNVTVYPADRCAQMNHDEDCSNGLWVSNQAGDSWSAYGDKQLWSGKSARNIMQAVKAAQAGVLEIWNTRQKGTIPDATDFAALKLVPILTDLSGPSNFVQLFAWDSSDPNNLSFRSNIDDRQDADQTSSIAAKQTFFGWQKFYDQLVASAISKNMYPFTMSFYSKTDVWHIRYADDENMFVNGYGNVDSGDYGAYWSMASQTMVSIPFFAGKMVWITVSRIDGDFYSLVGRYTPTNSTTISDRHLGLKISKNNDTEKVTIDVIWDAQKDNGNSYWTAGDTIYGDFSSDTADTGMIKYWTKGPRNASKLELWVIDSGMDTAPQKQSWKWDITPLKQIQTNDKSLTFVGYGLNPKTTTTMWYFSSWSSDYSVNSKNSSEETDVTFPTRVLLSGKFGTDDDGYRLVRAFYGTADDDTTPQNIRIDLINLTRSSSGDISPTLVQSQTFTITWSAFFPQDYLIWFLADVNVDDYLDLVTLVRKPDGSLNVIVFPGQSDFTFGDPIISEITLDPSKGSLFDASFMTHIKAGRAQYVYPNSNGTTSYTGIMAFFDNYGILGSRLLAPVGSGTYAYELKGQTPAIAGQISRGLGIMDNSWMDRGELPQTVGIIM